MSNIFQKQRGNKNFFRHTNALRSALKNCQRKSFKQKKSENKQKYRSAQKYERYQKYMDKYILYPKFLFFLIEIYLTYGTVKFKAYNMLI